MLTRSARRAVRAGLVLAVGIAVVGATGGTAFAGPVQYSRPSPDGGAKVRTFDIPALDGARKANDRQAGRTPAQRKANPATKTRSTAGSTARSTAKMKAKAKAQAKAKAKAKAKVAAAAPLATAAPPAAPPAATAVPGGVATAPGGVATAPGGVATAPGGVAAVGPPGAPAGVTVTAVAPTGLAVSWTADVRTAAVVDHFVVTAVEDPARTCRTPSNATTSCVVQPLAEGGAYTFTVRAIGVPGAGDSAPSAASAPATAGEVNDGMLDTTDAAAQHAAAAHQAAAAQQEPATQHDPTAQQEPATQHDPTAQQEPATQHDPAARQPAGAVRQDSGSKAGSVRVAQQAGRGRSLDKTRDTPRQAATGEPRAQAFGAATGSRMGLPRGTAGRPAMADAGRRKDRGPTGTLVLLGLGTLFAGLAAFGVTLVRRR
ncbi:fibronectin type III domain-containing protein [Dactylosporangium sp. NPDC050688]|uniref:fibronectin type III domain-containing protein n=1 Tax=Dactylosporangium sp. NPDC050688 TaxID=3157217 RepID=UPI00340D580B